MNYRSTLLYITTLCLLSTQFQFHVEVFADDVVDEQYECPDENAAFVTTCSGGDVDQAVTEEIANDGDEGGGEPEDRYVSEDEHVNDGTADDVSTEEELHNAETSQENLQNTEGIFDDSDILDELLQESSQQHTQSSQTCTPNFGDSNNPQEDPHDEISDNTNAMQQLQHTFVKLSHRYYDPLPAKAKCAVGTVCGFVSSRIALGVANRIVRLTGAIWVASEVLHTSGFCDETKCVPEEMRPWIGIIKRALIKQCMRVRLMARKIYDQERIRELAQKDGKFFGGFASGAFVGFVV
jgi:hypothetical protein